MDTFERDAVRLDEDSYQLAITRDQYRSAVLAAGLDDDLVDTLLKDVYEKVDEEGKGQVVMDDLMEALAASIKSKIEQKKKLKLEVTPGNAALVDKKTKQLLEPLEMDPLCPETPDMA